MSSWGPQIHPKKLEGTSLELQIDAKRLEGISLEPKIDPRRLEGSSLEVSWTKGMLQQGRSPRIRGLLDQGGASKNVFPKSPVRSPAKRVFTKDIFFRLSGWLVVAADGRKKVDVGFATWPCVFLKSKFSYGLIDICVKPFWASLGKTLESSFDRLGAFRRGPGEWVHASARGVGATGG